MNNNNLIKPDNHQKEQQEPEPTYEELLAKITNTKQIEFLENFPRFRTIKETCIPLEFSHWAVYKWQETDKTFLQAFQALKKRVTQDLILLHEKNIDNVTFNEKTPAQSRIFGSLVRLRAEAPQKYREKYQPLLYIPGNISVSLKVPGYNEDKIQVKTKEPVKLIEAKNSEHGVV